MKFFFLFLGISSLIFSTQAQDINAITIVARQYNEPQTIPGPTTYTLNFKIKNNKIHHTHYLIGEKRVRRNLPALSAEALPLINEWINTDKTVFDLQELTKELMIDSGMVSIDSFNFCKSFYALRSISTGGFAFNIIIKNKDGIEFEFDYTHPNMHLLDLKGYLTVFPLLYNQLPPDFPGRELFTESHLKKIITRYKDIITCEDYYYNEFKLKHPDRTARQNRTKEGWDFEKYLRERKANNTNN